MTTTMVLSAVPAAAIPIADVPADPTTWASAPYSPLTPSEVAPDNDVALEFTGTDGGLNGAGDIPTGFSIVQPASSKINATDATQRSAYLPQNLGVAGGRLNLTTSKGIAFGVFGTSGNDTTKNKQDNTLGVPLDTVGKKVRLTTTFAMPDAATSSAQGGLWFGPTDDNYVKFVVAAPDATARQIQLITEVNGVANTDAGNTTTQKLFNTTRTTITGTTPVTLQLDIDGTANSATGSYQIGTGAPVNIGTIPLPRNFVDGALLTGNVKTAGSTGVGGIFGTKRNMAETAPIVLPFERFAVQQLDTTPPAAVTNLTAAAATDSTPLAWVAPADTDVVGYRVFRSATTPVATTGNGLGGATPLVGTTFTDNDTFVGQVWNYAVVAVDSSGNVSPAATVAGTTPAPEGEPIAKIDFTTAAAAAATGYTKDSGAAYTAAAESGWVTADDATPFDFSINTRVRTADAGQPSDSRLLSIIHMAYGEATPPGTTGVNGERGTYVHDVPNGTYAVVAAVGDSSQGNYNSTHTIKVEGQSVITDFKPSATSGPQFEQGVATVEVTDGQLTVEAGGINTKLSFLEVYLVADAVEAPTAPQGVTATLGADKTSATLAWSAVDGAEEYVVFRSGTSPVATTGQPLVAGLTSPTFTDTGLSAGSTYHYVVVAKNVGGASPASAEATLQVPAAPVAPGAPTDLAAALGANNASVSLTWATAPDVTWNVFRSTTSPVAVTGAPLNATPLTASAFSDTGVAAGTTYHYAVVAVGSTGLVSGASNEASAVVPAAPVAPAAPVLSGTLSGSSAALTWAGVQGATTYDLYRSTSLVVSTTGLPLASGLTGTSYTDATVAAGTTYRYALVAAGTTGRSVASNTVSVTVPGGGPEVCATTSWSVQYFAGRALAGVPIAQDCVTAIDQGHVSGVALGNGVPAAEYSARFTSTVDRGAGTYTFTAVHDDGMRLYVDGSLVINAWVASNGRELKTASVDLAAGPHQVVVEYYQGKSAARLKVDMTYVAGQPPATCAPTKWTTEYFSGRNLAGVAIAEDCLSAIDQGHVSGGTLGNGVPTSEYSARFTTTVDRGAGTYTFTALHDDGMRLYVDGSLVIDAWVASNGRELKTASVDLAAGPHQVVVEYYQGKSAARLKVDMTYVAGQPPATCAPTKWTGTYFAGRAFAGTSIAETCTTALDFAHASGVAPGNGIPAAEYSARFTRTIDEGAGSYTFTALHDDGMRLRVDGTLVIDAWFASNGREPRTATVQLGNGPHTLAVEYYQGKSAAKLKLDWARQGGDTTPPAAPTALTATAADSSVALAWAASTSTDTVGYRVYRATSAGAPLGTPLNSALLTTRTFSDTTAVANTTYFYVVTAVDAAGNQSAKSNEVQGGWTFVPDTTAPDAPATLTQVPGDTSVTLTWAASASTDTVGYRVKRSLEPGAAANGIVISGTGLVAGTTYVDRTVTNGTTYFYSVVAVDGAGNVSTGSNEALSRPRVPNTTNIKVDFTAANAVPAGGYVADWGQAYGARSSANQGTGLTYGWVDEEGKDLALLTNGRDRNRPGIDERLDSMLHMQYGDVDNGNGTNGVKTEGTWELAVPEGLYEVTVAVGDQMGATTYDSQHTVNVEGAVGINAYQATAAAEFRTTTVTVGVWDGRLTLDPKSGFNTKIAYVDVKAIEYTSPHIWTVFPENRSLDADTNGGVAATIKVPYAGFGVDDATMPGNVQLFRVSDGSAVAGSVNTSGGNDTINFAPAEPLAPRTAYRFTVSNGVKDRLGNAWVPFESVFTTGAGVVDPGSSEFKPLTNIAFEKVELPIGDGKYWASFVFGPDGKLYGSTIGQGLFRFTVNTDGTLTNMENLGYAGIAMIGLLFDQSSTAGDLKLWVTNTSPNVSNEQNQWASGISQLTGANLQNRKQVFTEMPRSQSDHLTNSMIYGPGGDIYVLQGSNQAGGDLDGTWGQRGEQLLTAALLHFDPDHARVRAAVTDAEGDNPLSVKTAQGGTYDPYATDAPLKIYATGIRNAYDLVYHSNGHIYVPTNGTAAGGNTPGVTYNAATNTYTRQAAAGIPGFASVNGQDVTAACRARDARDATYTPRSVPPTSNVPTQRDHLYDVVEGGYYGHPNPTRCEWVLHEGNDPANPPKWGGGAAGNQTKYLPTVLPESNYKGVAYDFEFNKSPNGALEYQSSTFGGQLAKALVVVRFSNNNDLIFMQVDPATGKVLGAQTEVGLTGVPNTTMQGVGGFNDPLEVVEDTRNGNLYINQYDRAGSAQKLYLLRVPASQQAATVKVSKDELVLSAAKSNAGNASAAQKTDVESFTITNSSTESVALTGSITGTNAAEFTVVGSLPTTLAAGASATVQVRFTPGTTIGERSARLTLVGGKTTINLGLYGLSTNGIEGGNEPPLNSVLGTLGYEINIGWTNLEVGMNPAAIGEEVLEPLFVRSGTGPVSWKPLAHYAPPENIPFGWYTGDGTAADRRQLGAINGTNTVGGGYQSLLPPVTAGSTMSFDPGANEFGFYYFSGVFNRYGFTEDRLNTPAANAHRARIYPAKNRSGVLIANTYVVAFEDASNGDYQDYLFVVSGIKPKTDTGSGGSAIKVDFTTAAGGLVAGYLRDFGQAFGPKTGSDQGTGLTYGWKGQTTEDDLDISVGGTTPGNGRDRNSAQADARLDSFMHMQPTNVAGTFNGTNVNAYWELQVPNGTYEVTVGVGDPTVGTDTESHLIRAEGTTILTAFTPSGAAGSNTRHKVSTGTVTVTDGHLTIDPVGGVNTKIGFVDVVPVGVVDPGGDDPSDGAQVKMTFQPTGTPVPQGWTAETGGAFAVDRGYGWLNEATSQPIARPDATRYRTAPTGGIAFPTAAQQQGFAFLDNATQPTYTNGFWEYAVPNGTYEVAVSVGDANFLDSTHGVRVEGQPVITSFVPTATTPQQIGVRTVTVTDGRVTIRNGGTNTKLNWVSIKGEGLAPTTPTTSLSYSFRPTGAPVPAGWTADTGAAYNATSGSGWLVAGTPTDRSAMTRLRTAAAAGITYPTNDQPRQGLILMQATTTSGEPISGGTVGTWERALANGTYTVEVSVGDAGFTDSVHGVSAEGVALVTNYTPTGAAPFGTGSATVQVTDGRLTLTPTGVNTKLNWVRISGTALTAPSITARVNGTAVAGTYNGGAATVDLSASVASDATLASLSYTLDGGAATPYTAPFTVAAVGTHQVVVTATDSAGRTSTRTLTLEVLNIGGTVKLTNGQVVRQGDGTPIPGLYEDVLVMHRVNSLGTAETHQSLKFNDTVTLTVGNTGTKDLRITSLDLGGATGQFEIVGAPTLPLLIAPGASVPLTVKFVATNGGRGVRTGTLTMATSDPAAANRVVQLRGGYMTAPEGGSELSLEHIFQLYGSTTTSGVPASATSIGNGSEIPGAPLNGDEVRSFQWKRLDNTKPVQAVQLAAFHGCCGQTENFNINGASATHAGPYGQAIYPLKSDGTKTAISTNPTGNFGITVAGQSTTQTQWMAVKMWPVKDAAGKVVPGSWFAGHDYINSPAQCGTGPTNCDFQDNVYLVTNVLPVASSDTTAPTAPAAPTGVANATGVDLTWAASTDADLIGYRIERGTSATGPWTNLGGALLTGTTFRDNGAAAAATTHYRVVAVDASGNATASAVAAINTGAIVAAPIRINAGGPALTLGGVTWQADAFFSGGKTYANNAITDILGTTNDALYRTERSATTGPGTFSYNVPVSSSGTYEVKLHFAEIYHGATGGGAGGTGKRVFSVNLEGGPVEIANLDINARVAPMTALITTNTIAVTDGTLNMTFTSTVDQPKVSAIEIVKVP
ncbi:Fibronectin type III domain protein [Serinibacter arcticus]|uniref:Fibronectin type III domain protein n=1 Tax=Serinibacter arcticus TaxID=1655435 RepID=A0A4Z1E3W1_9MICO|nr:Fibronectin type III domain protein [Serinibacter arcticus]